jgi:hypothetical protein
MSEYAPVAKLMRARPTTGVATTAPLQKMICLVIRSQSNENKISHRYRRRTGQLVCGQ